MIFTLFILVKREDLRNRMLRLAGSGQLNVMTQALDEASHRLGRYLLLQFLVNAAYGLLFGLGIYLLGVPHSLLWGVLGTLSALCSIHRHGRRSPFPMGMAMAVFPGWWQVGVVFALFLILELTIANLIEPWLYGSHIGVSSLAILVAAIFWGMLWGPGRLGPVYAFNRVPDLARQIYSTIKFSGNHARRRASALSADAFLFSSPRTR